MQSNRPNGEQVEPQDADMALVAYDQQAESIGLTRLRGGVMTSLDPKNPEQRQTLYQAMMGEAEKADGYLNTELAVTDILISEASSTNAETGQVEKWLRCVLILADGRRIAFGSLGVLKSLAFYSMCFKPPPWSPPAMFKLKSTPIGKNRWYTLEAVENLPTLIKRGK